MTIKNRCKNISAESGDIVIDVDKNNLTKDDDDSNFSNNLELIITQQDFLDETNTSHTKTLIIPTSEFVRLAYLIKNYYTKTQINMNFGVTVDKQSVPDSGSVATYIIKQNGEQVGTKINIPKDFLIKSATLKTVSTNNEPLQGYKVGDKYIDFIINTKNNDDTDEHIYINVKDLVDVYTADESSLTVSDNQFSIKEEGITEIHLEDALQNLINSKIDTAGTGLTKEGTSLKINFSSATNSDSETTAATPKAIKTAIGEIQDYIDEEIIGLFDPSGQITLQIATKADAEHSHGRITHDGKIGTSKAIVVTDDYGNVTTSSTIQKSQISDFAHDQASSTITDIITYPNIANTSQTQSGINFAINARLGEKVDKVSGKGLSTKDFTADLLTKLNGIETGANKYTHPTQSAITGKPTGNQSPAFGSAFTVSQVSVNTMGHVISLTDRDITIPGTEASTSGKGLMSKTDKTKLDGIANNANNYSHPTHTAITGKPIGNQSPSFGNSFTVSQIVTNTLGHVTGATDRTITIPDSLGTTSAIGLVKLADNITTSDYTSGLALSANQGKILDDKITQASHVILRFGNTNSSSVNSSSVTIAPGGRLYVYCLDYKGNKLSGTIIFKMSNNAYYEKTLSNGIADIAINYLSSGQSGYIEAWYHNSGNHLASGICKVNVS